MIGNGSKTLVYIALKLLLERGDKVCLFRPFYPAYLSLLIDFESQITYLDFQDDYLKTIQEVQPKMLIVTSPNNPDGYTFSKKELDQLSSLTKELGCYLIIDEAYRNFIYDVNTKSQLEDFEYDQHVIVLRTFSKALAICGWRIGYAIANPKIIQKMVKIQLSFFNPLNRVMQRALSKYLQKPEDQYPSHVENIFKRRLEKICECFLKREINIHCPQGAFYVFLELDLEDTQQFCLDLALETGIILWPGFDFGKPRFLRISIAQLEIEQIETMVNGFVDYLQSQKKSIL